MDVIWRNDEVVIVAMPVEAWEALTVEPEPEPVDCVLSIPHLSQNGPGADARRNDCGAACVAMVVNGLQGRALTVDEVAIKFQKRPNRYMGMGDLIEALRFYGLDAVYTRPIRAEMMAAALAAGRPLIALVKYPQLPKQWANFSGSHFIVIYGIEGEVVRYHDPLSLVETSAATVAEMMVAMSGFDAGENLPYQALIVHERV